MSHEESTEDLNTSVSELTNLMNDTFTCCVRNYEALLPYLEKKKTQLKIYHRLVQINIMLNKLNEELIGLRVEYVTVSSYERKREIPLAEAGRKRKKSGVAELDRHTTKYIKTELPFSSNTECSISLSLDNAINMQSENVISKYTKETRSSQVLKLDMHSAKNIKTEIRDSDEVDNILALTTDSGDIPAAQTKCDTRNVSLMVDLAGDKDITSVSDRIILDTAYDKPADSVTHMESNEEYVSLQNVTRRASSQENCENNGQLLSKDHDNDRQVAVGAVCATPFSSQANRSLNRLVSPVAITTCNLKNAELLEGRTNSCNQKEGSSFAKVGNSSCDSTPPSIWYASASCSLADTVAVAENDCELKSIEHEVKLNDIWRYFAEPFRISRKHFKIKSRRIMCLLCNHYIERNVICVKRHISTPDHIKRIQRLSNLEVSFNKSNKQRFDIPGILENIIPRTQFSLEKNGFFCSVCKCHCKNEVVLTHLTSEGHSNKLHQQ